MDLLTKGIFHVHLKDSARWQWFVLVTNHGIDNDSDDIWEDFKKVVRDGSWNSKTGTTGSQTPDEIQWKIMPELWDLFEALPQVWQGLSNGWCFPVVKSESGMICNEISISWHLLEIHTHNKYMQHMHMSMAFDHKHSLTCLQFTKSLFALWVKITFPCHHWRGGGGCPSPGNGY